MQWNIPVTQRADGRWTDELSQCKLYPDADAALDGANRDARFWITAGQGRGVLAMRLETTGNPVYQAIMDAQAEYLTVAERGPYCTRCGDLQLSGGSVLCPDSRHGEGPHRWTSERLSAEDQAFLARYEIHLEQAAREV